MNGIRVLREGYVQPSAGTRVVDDGRIRPLDGAIVLGQTDRCAVLVESVGKVLVLEAGSRHYTDDEAIRVASMPPAERFQIEPRDLDERIERAIERAVMTCHKRRPCIVCGAQQGRRCVHREQGEPTVELDRPHNARLDPDLVP